MTNLEQLKTELSAVCRKHKVIVYADRDVRILACGGSFPDYEGSWYGFGHRIGVRHYEEFDCIGWPEAHEPYVAPALDKDLIKSVCLKHGYKLKTQPDGTEDLNQYVYAAAQELMGVKPVPDVSEQVEGVMELVYKFGNKVLDGTMFQANNGNEELESIRTRLTELLGGTQSNESGRV